MNVTRNWLYSLLALVLCLLSPQAQAQIVVPESGAELYGAVDPGEFETDVDNYALLAYYFSSRSFTTVEISKYLDWLGWSWVEIKEFIDWYLGGKNNRGPSSRSSSMGG